MFCPGDKKITKEVKIKFCPNLKVLLVQFSPWFNRQVKLWDVRVETAQLPEGAAALLAVELRLARRNLEVVDANDVSSQIAWKNNMA